MYQLGEYVVYGNSGVCRVEEIGSIMAAGAERERIYYTLSPIYISGSTVFTPVDSEKSKIRPVISKEELSELLSEAATIPVLQVGDEKKREEIYKTAYKTYECREWVKLIKTSYERKQERIKEGKHTATSDEKYLHLAEDSLYGELAIPLQIEKQQVEEYMRKYMGHTEEKIAD